MIDDRTDAAPIRQQLMLVGATIALPSLPVPSPDWLAVVVGSHWTHEWDEAVPPMPNCEYGSPQHKDAWRALPPEQQEAKRALLTDEERCELEEQTRRTVESAEERALSQATAQTQSRALALREQSPSYRTWKDGFLRELEHWCRRASRADLLCSEPVRQVPNAWYAERVQAWWPSTRLHWALSRMDGLRRIASAHLHRGFPLDVVLSEVLSAGLDLCRALARTDEALAREQKQDYDAARENDGLKHWTELSDVALMLEQSPDVPPNFCTDEFGPIAEFARNPRVVRAVGPPMDDIEDYVRRLLDGCELRDRNRGCLVSHDKRLRAEVVARLRPAVSPPRRSPRPGDDAKEVLDLQPARQAQLPAPQWEHFDRVLIIDRDAPPVAKDEACRAALPHLDGPERDEALRQLGLWATARGVTGAKRTLQPGGPRIPCLIGVRLRRE
jgi:hypothetical protein